MKYKLFVYGTLKNKRLLESLHNRGFGIRHATLDGYSCHNVRNCPFPGIKKNKGHRVRGVVLSNIPKSELDRFDRYEAEGDLYHRTPVEVLLDNGDVMQVETYVFANPENLEEEAVEEWQR